MKLSSIARINLTVIAVCVTAVLFANVLGFFPDERSIREQQRAKLAETVATSLAHLVSKHDYKQAEAQIEVLVKRNPDIITAGLRRNDREIMAAASEHQSLWHTGLSKNSDGCYVVPVRSMHDEWGSVEIRFKPLSSGFLGPINPALVKLIALLTPLVGLASWLHLSRILKYLDPSQAVPTRVRQTLDSFAEGVVLLDLQHRIVLANEAFASALKTTTAELMGKRLGDLPWLSEDGESQEGHAWAFTLEQHKFVHGATASLVDKERNVLAVFSVNSSPVLDERGQYQGAMVAFADVTPLEKKRAELAFALAELNQSQDEIKKQNCELSYLATRDPLTGCVNRRIFFEAFEEYWNNAEQNGADLSVLMIDVDFFKQINDNHGHSMGDEVLRQTGSLLNGMARPGDIVCRYGGEEFTLLMPVTSLDEATQAAEAIRIKLSELDFGAFSITASLGVSEQRLGASDAQNLLDQADQCLYAAKRNGRNQVVRFDSIPECLEVEAEDSRNLPDASLPAAKSIPYSAVTALLSALSYRDSQTGAHSVRVANYAALLAQEYLRPSEVYVVEIASLLHDIGKIGVPDSILLKPGRLSEEEWKIMEQHDLIGVEIISKSFKHPELTGIVRDHHCRWDGMGASLKQPIGEAIPFGARILAIVDAFDAMVSHRPYRRGMPVADALAELRRCAGTQFDPKVTHQFCEIVEAGKLLLSDGKEGVSADIVLSVGEQLQGLLEAIDSGNRKAILALAGRMQQTAQQFQTTKLAEAVGSVISLTNEETTIEEIARESQELLSICRSMHTSIAKVNDNRAPSMPTKADDSLDIEAIGSATGLAKDLEQALN